MDSLKDNSAMSQWTTNNGSFTSESLIEYGWVYGSRREFTKNDSFPSFWESFTGIHGKVTFTIEQYGSLSPSILSDSHLTEWTLKYYLILVFATIISFSNG